MGRGVKARRYGVRAYVAHGPRLARVHKRAMMVSGHCPIDGGESAENLILKLIAQASELHLYVSGRYCLKLE